MTLLYKDSNDKTSQKTEALDNETPFSMRVFVLWVMWATILLCSILCMIPGYSRASLWLPHLHLRLDEKDSSAWADYVDELLLLITSYATSLRNVSKSTAESGIALARNSAYTFDYTSWCRENSAASLMSCHSGVGLDVVKNLVIDFGIQIGVAGRVENPTAFGRAVASKFGQTVKNLNQMYLDTRNTDALDHWDLQRLLLMHNIFSSGRLASAILSIKFTQIGLALLASGLFAYLLLLKHVKSASYFKLTIIVPMTLCELCSFVIYTLETIYIGKLNASMRPVGAHFTAGLGLKILIVQLLSGVGICASHLLFTS